MKHREKRRRGHRDAASPSETEIRNRGSLRHYVLLAGISLAVAVVICVVVTVLTPPDDSERVSEEKEVWPPTPAVDLPAKPAEISAEAIKKELLQRADDLLVRFPQLPEAKHVAAIMFTDIQKTAEAEKLWRECITMAPEYVGPYVGLATVVMQVGKDEEAVDTLRKALSAGCSSPDLYDKLATALTKLGRLEEAERVVKEGLAKFPHAAENWLQLGQVQIQLERFAEAEKSLEQAIAEGTPSESVYFSLATACSRQGKSEQAAEYRREFSERKARQTKQASAPFQVRYDAELRRIAVAFASRAAAILDRQSLPSEAEQLYLRAVSLDPANRLICGDLVSFYRKTKRFADAVAVQRRLVEIDPQEVVNHVNLASLSTELGDYATAEAALKKVIELRPELSVGYQGLAQLYLQTSKFEQARWFAEAALRQQPTSREETARTYATLSAACQLLGDNVAAEHALNQARKLTPEK